MAFSTELTFAISFVQIYNQGNQLYTPSVSPNCLIWNRYWMFGIASCRRSVMVDF